MVPNLVSRVNKKWDGGGCTHNFERWPIKGHPRQIWLNLVQQVRGEELNVIFYQNVPYLNNRYISIEIHRKS